MKRLLLILCPVVFMLGCSGPKVQLDEYREHRKKVKLLQADYYSSESQFQAAYDQFNPKFEAMLTQLISARQALVALTTEEEWQKISAREKSYIPKTTH
jgi:hypothetical protein